MEYISTPVFLLGLLKFVDTLKEANFKIFQTRYWHLRKLNTGDLSQTMSLKFRYGASTQEEASVFLGMQR